IAHHLVTASTSAAARRRARSAWQDSRRYITIVLALAAGSWLCGGPLRGQVVPGLVFVQVPAHPLIGESFTFRVEVSPHPSVIGFGPFLEIYLPFEGGDCTKASERCDGISFVKAEAVFAVTRQTLAPCPAGATPFVFGTS